MSAPQTAVAVITAEAYWAIQPLPHTELVHGEIVQLSPTSPRHGAVEANLSFLLMAWAYEHNGRVLTGEVGYRLDATTVRAPDVALHLNDPEMPESGWFEVIPDLVVEVTSPSDSWTAVGRKAKLWLAAGVQEVWLADPDQRTVVTHTCAGVMALFQGDQPLVSALLPNLSIDLTRVFR